MRGSRLLMPLAAAVVAAGLLVAGAARADGTCRSVEVLFKPTGNLQIAVWIETADGRYVDTAYVTRLTGSLGIGNRPGLPGFKSDFRWPYGRREMVLPVWAHARNVRYKKVVMGGRYGNSVASCAANGTAGSDCDDTTIGYHFTVSSPEPFFCSPRGGVTIKQNGVDVVSCASSFYGCKGAYANDPDYSLYPPRADLTSFVDDHDSPESKAYATVNDLGAVSAATPPANQLLATPIRWIAPGGLPDGQYVLKVEAHLEGDFNAFHHYPSTNDAHAELNGYGKDFMGQPSIVYAVPFELSSTATYVNTTMDYVGYSDWDGATGTIHMPDMTISTDDGTGVGRLLPTSDASGAYRLKVTALPTCNGGGGPCTPPPAPANLVLTPGPTSITASFASATGGAATARFDVRYREAAPIDDVSFLQAIPSSTAPPTPGAPGSTVQTMIGGLRPQTKYTVAVRALATCDAASPIAVASITTDQAKFVTLSGCFIATAAYGTPLAAEIDVLRRLRDRVLLTNTAGRLLVATYYALSPPVARALTTDETLRAAARALVRPLVRAVQAAGG